MGKPPKNYVESFLPLMTVYAIIGHEVFRYPASTPRVGWSIFYTIVMLMVTAILLYFTFLHALTFNYDTIEEKMFIFICGLNIVIVLCTASLSWYHYKRRKRVVERITAVDETLKELGADCEHERTYRSAISCLVTQLILVVVLNSVDTIWVIDKYNVFEMFWLVGVTHHPYHVSNYVLMKYWMTMRGVGVRFRITNKLLEEILKHRGTKEKCGNTSISRRKINRVNPTRVASRRNIQKNVMLIMKQVHLELCNISESMNTIYGIQIVLQFGAYFAFFTVLGYDLYVIYVNPTFMNRSRRICALSFWFFVHFMKILVVNHMSASVTCEAYRTREIVQELNIMVDDPDFKDELRQFSLQMMANELSFTPMGFFTLGYELVRSVLGTVATYLVILIQTNIIPEFMLAHNK